MALWDSSVTLLFQSPSCCFPVVLRMLQPLQGQGEAWGAMAGPTGNILHWSRDEPQLPFPRLCSSPSAWLTPGEGAALPESRVGTETPMRAAEQHEEDEGEAGRRDREDLLRKMSGWGHKRKFWTIHLNSVVSSPQAGCVQPHSCHLLQGFVKLLSGIPD